MEEEKKARYWQNETLHNVNSKKCCLFFFLKKEMRPGAGKNKNYFPPFSLDRIKVNIIKD